MTRYYCHEHPDVLTIETRVVDARPGAVLLEDTPFYPSRSSSRVWCRQQSIRASAI